LAGTQGIFARRANICFVEIIMENEATTRIKINKMLEEAGWNLIGENKNVEVEYSRSDYMLLDSRKYPLCVLEAKKENVNPLSAKEQARNYAEKQNARFVILSNGEISYFWDIQTANPEIITRMPSQKSLEERANLKRDKTAFESENIIPEYIVLSQNQNLLKEPNYIDENTREKFCKDNGYRILRPYQINAIMSVQKSASNGNSRFLIEMATGLGKTLTAAAIIKMFLKTGNANRILFLVDRLELERQANKDLRKYLSKDYESFIYKEHKNDWQKANIVISTIQSFLIGNKYKIFSPTDFDFVISDEAHRSIGGDSRAVFEYFIGYKLGLTATPKDYLKNTNILDFKDQRTWEKRVLLDTYKTFGCESSEPTFKFSLPQGVKEGYLINPYVLDIKTEITTELLSKEGYAAIGVDEKGESTEDTVFGNDFEKKFFNENINRKFCECFIENAELDPVSGEIGKSIVFCVSQNHAAKITQILNEMAMEKFPSKYNSDFAKQVTSIVQNSQDMAIHFAEANNLGGKSRFLEGYDTCKTRVCVTVAMMTTGYDCPDLLNIAFMRPIFSPTDFVQMKGRGTRKYSFSGVEKTQFKLFDFFRICEYFENDFNYSQSLTLPSEKSKPKTGDDGKDVVYTVPEILISSAKDNVKTSKYIAVPEEGMRIDREFWGTVEDECDKYISIYKPSGEIAYLIRNFIKSYTSDLRFRDIIEQKKFAELNTYTGFSFNDYKSLGDLKTELPEYIKGNSALNKCMEEYARFRN